MKLEPTRKALRAALRRLGRTGVAGLALLATALSFYLSALVPAREETAALQWRRAQVEKHGRVAVAAGSGAQFERFMDFFPPLDSSPDWLRTLYAVADREKLELAQGSYRLSEDRVLGLAHYRISLPVRGGYPQIRRFIAGALDEIPAISLEDVVFQREKVGDGGVEAKIGLTLHLKSAPRPAPALGMS